MARPPLGRPRGKDRDRDFVAWKLRVAKQTRCTTSDSESHAKRCADAARVIEQSHSKADVLDAHADGAWLPYWVCEELGLSTYTHWDGERRPIEPVAEVDDSDVGRFVRTLASKVHASTDATDADRDVANRIATVVRDRATGEALEEILEIEGLPSWAARDGRKLLREPTGA